MSCCVHPSSPTSWFCFLFRSHAHLWFYHYVHQAGHLGRHFWRSMSSLSRVLGMNLWIRACISSLFYILFRTLVRPPPLFYTSCRSKCLLAIRQWLRRMFRRSVGRRRKSCIHPLCPWRTVRHKPTAKLESWEKVLLRRTSSIGQQSWNRTLASWVWLFHARFDRTLDMARNSVKISLPSAFPPPRRPYHQLRTIVEPWSWWPCCITDG